MAKQEKKNKRADRPRACSYTPEFNKAWKRYNQAGRRDMNEATEVMTLLWQGKPLPPEYLDHELKGDWKGFRECHIGGDFLLIYDIQDDLIVFTALGSHSELFK